MNSLVKYVKATKEEMRHVRWPTRRQAVIFTVLIIAVTIITAIFLGFFDFLFSDVVVERFFIGN
ncbi:MAG: preprotein translocase subunit SecE [Candidatus Paceibacterota bacterium]